MLAASLLTSLSVSAQETNKVMNLSPSSFTLGAYIETYYSYDLNNALGNTKPSFLYSFNKNNEAAINLALLKHACNLANCKANKQTPPVSSRRTV